MKKVLFFACLLFSQAGLTHVLERITEGPYQAFCQSQGSTNDAAYTSATIQKYGDEAHVELHGSAYQGSVPLSVPFDFSGVPVKTKEESKSSITGAGLPGTEIKITEKKATEDSATIRTTTKYVFGFILVGATESVATLSQSDHSLTLTLSLSEGEALSCTLTPDANL